MALFPKSTDFFKIFVDLSSLVAKAGSLTQNLKNGKRNSILLSSKQARRLELEANRIRHYLSERADSNFITPIDREDIHVLARNLDDIIDEIENLVSDMKAYDIKRDKTDFHELTQTINEATAKVHELISLLKQKEKKLGAMKKVIREIRMLENEGDELNKLAITRLFETEKNAILVLKWNQIFRTSEKILDRCEDTADTVNEIIIKNF
jgi:uncharacterized protein Yka (UPF0111/DUF47 family)